MMNQRLSEAEGKEMHKMYKQASDNSSVAPEKCLAKGWGEPKFTLSYLRLRLTISHLHYLHHRLESSLISLCLYSSTCPQIVRWKNHWGHCSPSRQALL